MGLKERTDNRKVKIFTARELALYFGVSEQTMRKRLKGVNLYSVKSTIDYLRSSYGQS